MKKLLCISTLLALAGSCFAEPVRVVAYGDSITYAWIPNANPPSTRYGPLRIAIGGSSELPVVLKPAWPKIRWGDHARHDAMVVARWARVHGPKRYGGAGISPTDDEDELEVFVIN